MHTNIKLIALAFFLIISFYFLKQSHSDEWVILFPVIPEKVSVDNANINIVQYLLKQTHEPIFNEIDVDVYESNLLSSWSRDAKNTKFKFCIRKDIEFYKGRLWSLSDLEKSLLKVEEKYKISSVHRIEDDCLLSEYDKPVHGLLKMLSKIENAPAVISENKIEYGLGKYNFQNRDTNQLVLERKNGKKVGGFNKIRLIKFTKESDPVPLEVHDFNRALVQVPNINSDVFERHEVRVLQTINLILNIKNEHIRTILSNQINPELFRKAFAPTINNFVEICTILPIEIYPAACSKSHKDSSAENISVKLNFINWRDKNDALLKHYFQKLFEMTGIQISVVNVSPNEFVHVLSEKNHEYLKYDLFVMAIDSGSSELTPFFRPFFDENKKHLSFQIKDALFLYRQLNSVYRQDTKLETAKTLAKKIQDYHLAIPLYQVKKTFLYPKYITGLKTGKDFLEYPIVDELGY